MKQILLFILILATMSAAAQQPCRDCQCLIDKADAAIRAKDYRAAIEKLNAAKACDKTKEAEVNKKILQVFSLIEKQRDEAEKNKQIALNSEANAKNALAKAETLVDFFSFSQNRAWAYQDGKFAVISGDGQLITEFRYDNPNPFLEYGYAIAQKDGLYLFLDKDGKESELFDYILPTNNDWYKVKKDDRYTFIRKELLDTINIGWCEQIDAFENGLARVKKNNKWGYINNNSQIVIPFQFNFLGTFQEGLALAQIDDKQGFVDDNGQIVIQPQFDEVADFHEGMARVKKNGKWGFVDKSGQIVVQPQFDHVEDFSEGVALVNIGGMKDEYGNIIGGKWGFIDEKGRVVINLQFAQAEDFSEGMARIEKDGRIGFVDKNGQIAIKPQFDQAYNFSNGVARVQRFGEWFLINKKGELVITPEAPPKKKDGEH